MTDKQPQTCYVETDGNFGIELSLLNDEVVIVNKLESVYIFTKEELESKKMEWMREAADKALNLASTMNYNGTLLSDTLIVDYLNNKCPSPNKQVEDENSSN